MELLVVRSRFFEVNEWRLKQAALTRVREGKRRLERIQPLP